MKMLAQWCVCLLGLLFWTGCATSALLNSGPKQYQPAKPPNIAALENKDGKRILIVYDEQSDNYQKPRRRGYWVDPQAEPPSKPQKPVFVEPRRGRRLRSIPMADEPAPIGLSAVPDQNDPTSFTLYRDGEKLWTYTLPVYERPRFTLTQSALLPVAVAADLTVVGGILFAYALASSGSSGTF